MPVAHRSFRPFEGTPYVDRLLIECSPFPMVELEGPQLIIRDVNSLFCRMMATPRDAIVGKPYSDVVPDPQSLVVLDRVYRSGVSELHGEPERIEKQPESWAYMAWPVLDATKTPLGVVMQVTGPTLLQRARAMNEALMVSVVDQHERTDLAEMLNCQLAAEIEQRKRAEAELGKSEARFRALADMSSDWYWEQDENFRFTDIVQPIHKDEEFESASCLGKTRWELPPNSAGKAPWEKHRELLRKQLPFRNFEYQRQNAQGEQFWISVNGDPVFDGSGKFCGYRGTGRDISERKRHQEQIELVMREVAHREKNALSLVIAVARQTASVTPEHFLERFTARLHAMAANLDLLVNSPQGVDVGKLVRSQLAHFRDLIDTRIQLRGPPLRLNPGAARIIGMAVHELATNAAKYGALTNDTGLIDIDWSIRKTASGPRLVLSWIEGNGPPVVKPTSQGFGSVVLSKMARAGLGADISHEYPCTGMRWSLDCPAPKALEEGS